ncbi:MAG: MarR family winged helix-turn-helix transcriptional regulator [Eubacterium sp.]|jgi:DNA-binding MarR family transcriptional regulator
MEKTTQRIQQELTAPGRRISALSNIYRRRLDQLTTQTEYSGAQSKALHFILANYREKAIVQKDIEREYGLRPPTASELLKKMEGSGLVIRKTMQEDARKKQILPTEKALRYKDQVAQNIEGLNASLMRGVSRQDMEVFLRVLDQMVENLAEDVEKYRTEQ